MFAKFKWEDRYSIKIKKMDDQHKVLIDYINKLAESMDTDDYSKITPAFKELAGYVVKHFQEEEAFFDSENFPGATTHKIIHQKLLESVGAYQVQIENKKLEKEKFYEFLKIWLTSHIIGIDTKYGEYILTKK